MLPHSSFMKLHTLSVEAIVSDLNTHRLPSYGPAFPIHFMLQTFSFFIDALSSVLLSL